MAPPIRVVVVDDSALVRGLLAGIIDREADLRCVGAASDALAAREMIRALDPDVITLDVEMPRMDGLEFLSRLMRLRPMPVVMVSTLTERGAEATLRALELGAVDFVAKPRAGVADGLRGMAGELTAKLRVAARARVRRAAAAAPAAAPVAAPPAASVAASVAASWVASGGKTSCTANRASSPAARGATRGATADEASTIHAPAATLGAATTARARTAATAECGCVVFIGASTGGTEATRALLAALPADAPPILIAQHMPAGFTRSYAERLDGLCRIRVSEARHGEPLRRGHALVAPGGRHLGVKRVAGGYRACVFDAEPVNRHRPSVEVLFDAAARVVGADAIGIMLTGMGADGALAMKAMRDAGALTFAQDEASCVVFGMPREAIAAGAVDEVLPPLAIAERLLARLADTRAGADCGA